MSKTAKPRAKRGARPAIDPAAAGAVLRYLGGRTRRYVPARDLEGVDVARIAYRRAADAMRASRSALRRPGETRPAPRRADQPGPAALAATADELVATGQFAWLKNAPEGVTAPDVDVAATAPADEPSEPAAGGPTPDPDEPTPQRSTALEAGKVASS
jgi:hypothetical protein